MDLDFSSPAKVSDHELCELRACGLEFRDRGRRQRFDTEKEAEVFLESLKDATFSVSDVKKSPGTRNPAAPFTTSTLQQEANSKLGFSSRATMTAAQKLYQDGKITYMRTDSVNLSGQAIASALIRPPRMFSMVVLRSLMNTSTSPARRPTIAGPPPR